LLVNEALSKMTGYPVPKLLGMSVLQIIGSEERSGLHSSLTRATLGRRTPIRVSTRYQPASGDRVWAELTTTPVLDEDGTARTGISCLQSLSPRDTPEVERSARHDSQTGLLTPAALRQELADALHRSRRFDTNGALFVAQIEHVDPATRLPVADQEGDLFAMAARRLAAVLRAEDSITRLDDNTVAVLIEEISVSDASGMSERIGAALRQLVTREGRAIETRADIGVAVLGDQCDDADAVLTQVDVALKRAKRIGPNTHVLFERVEDPPVKPQQAKQPLYSRSAEEAHNHS
jgi:PAS domain S-box-containing protein/diguanylate cyclase (GGDEF)-like protein